MARPHYRITWADAVRGHEQALEDGGAPGIVSEHAIQSAIARPYHGYHRFIHQKAAALLHGIVTNHGFSDGNKRTALYLVELLAERSGYTFVEDDIVIADTITSVAQGKIGYDELADWFKQRLVRVAT
ncbi:MAG: type II toxin-antitoxin system death-on-curing family toxin [Proteobacteria bacterium]|nr:type II toxin-antitoxin system death-on-curing family toxin [Pseudomonadota bacterium]